MEKKYIIMIGFVGLFSSIAFGSEMDHAEYPYQPDHASGSYYHENPRVVDGGYKPGDFDSDHHEESLPPEQHSVDNGGQDDNNGMYHGDHIDPTTSVKGPIVETGEPISTVAVIDTTGGHDSQQEKDDAQDALIDAQGDLTIINNPSDQQGAAPIVSSAIAEQGLWKKFTNAVTKVFGSVQAKVAVHSEELTANQQNAQLLQKQIDRAQRLRVRPDDGTVAGKNLAIAQKQKIQADAQVIQSTQAINGLKRTLVNDVDAQQKILLKGNTVASAVVLADPVMQDAQRQVSQLMTAKVNRSGKLDSTQTLQDIQDLPGALSACDTRIDQILIAQNQVMGLLKVADPKQVKETLTMSLDDYKDSLQTLSEHGVDKNGKDYQDFLRNIDIVSLKIEVYNAMYPDSTVVVTDRKGSGVGPIPPKIAVGKSGRQMGNVDQDRDVLLDPDGSDINDYGAVVSIAHPQ